MQINIDVIVNQTFISHILNQRDRNKNYIMNCRHIFEMYPTLHQKNYDKARYLH